MKKSPYNWVVFHPLCNLNNQVFFSLLTWVSLPKLLLWSLQPARPPYWKARPSAPKAGHVVSIRPLPFGMLMELPETNRFYADKLRPLEVWGDEPNLETTSSFQVLCLFVSFREGHKLGCETTYFGGIYPTPLEGLLSFTTIETLSFMDTLDP